MDSVRNAAQLARDASYGVASLDLETRNEALSAIAEGLKASMGRIVEANRKDLEAAQAAKIPQVMIKRLRYDEEKIEESIQSIHSLMGQEDVVGKLLSRTELDDGLVLDRISSPIGVIGVVFESRPDALVQISCLCLRSGNTVLLKGGVEAKETNEVLAGIIAKASTSVDERFRNAVQLLSTREQFQELLRHDDLIDLIIPRGSNELVRAIKEATRIPVLGHAAGICHTFVDKAADRDMALKVCLDAKTQYPAVCNAMETLLVHRDVARDFLPTMAEKYAEAGVLLKGDEEVRGIITADAATEDDWSIEYGDLVLNVHVVGSVEEAIDHINRYSSQHTDAIITDDADAARQFLEAVDSSSVMWNASTRFADGYRYGLGAEVGISTNKTHARGPVGLDGMVIYKYVLTGSGHIVGDYSGPDARSFTHRRLQ